MMKLVNLHNTVESGQRPKKTIQKTREIGAKTAEIACFFIGQRSSFPAPFAFCATSRNRERGIFVGVGSQRSTQKLSSPMHSVPEE